MIQNVQPTLPCSILPEFWNKRMWSRKKNIDFTLGKETVAILAVSLRYSPAVQHIPSAGRENAQKTSVFFFFKWINLKNPFWKIFKFCLPWSSAHHCCMTQLLLSSFLFVLPEWIIYFLKLLHWKLQSGTTCWLVNAGDVYCVWGDQDAEKTVSPFSKNHSSGRGRMLNTVVRSFLLNLSEDSDQELLTCYYFVNYNHHNKKHDYDDHNDYDESFVIAVRRWYWKMTKKMTFHCFYISVKTKTGLHKLTT